MVCKLFSNVLIYDICVSWYVIYLYIHICIYKREKAHTARCKQIGESK